MEEALGTQSVSSILEPPANARPESSAPRGSTSAADPRRAWIRLAARSWLPLGLALSLSGCGEGRPSFAEGDSPASRSAGEARAPLYRAYLGEGTGELRRSRLFAALEPGASPFDTCSELVAAAQERRKESSLEVAGALDELQEAARGYWDDPVDLASTCTESSGNTLLQFWTVVAHLHRLEQSVDERLGRGAWRKLSADYRLEHALVRMLPEALLAIPALADLRAAQGIERITDDLAWAVDPRSGLPLLVLLGEQDPRWSFGREYCDAVGISYGMTDERIPDARHLHWANGSWTLASFAAVRDLWSTLSAHEQDRDMLRGELERVLGYYADNSASVVHRMPINVRFNFYMTYLVEAAQSSGATPASWSVPSPTIPILTPTGINPILMGGNANPWSFGGGR